MQKFIHVEIKNPEIIFSIEKAVKRVFGVFTPSFTA